MLVARIRLTDGPERGAATYATVEHGLDGSVSYLPIADPFRPDSATSRITGRVPAEHAELLAPCEPRVLLGMAHNTGPADRLLAPQAFHKSPHSVIGPGRPIELEPEDTEVDGEAELAVVIGTRARRLTPETALAAVYGYTCANDVTDRAAQVSDSRWTEAKSRDTFTPLGPWIRTDLDPTDLTVLLSDDEHPGTVARTTDLARDVAEVLVYLTSILTLYPGDVVLVGAPGPSLRLRAGGVSRVSIPGIGELVNPVQLSDNAVAASHLVGATPTSGKVGQS
jgi:2-keto-4-pentenoate hydratase/2-oxohepta-3-ene-1,7-dioic acid hydratase in catechol pathway